MSGYVVGKLAADADELGRGGWVIGSFFDTDSTESGRHCSELEVKYWSYPQGGGQAHRMKSSKTTEWSMILSGRSRAVVGDSVFELQGGDYVLIHPDTPNNLVAEVLSDIVAITVKAPSEPTAKRLL
jgi:mannose-6-phosphate isomerase-like protein (cupin superfamily)